MAAEEAVPARGGRVFARISDEPLDLDLHTEAVAGSGFGAIVTFVGQIRDHDPEAAGVVEQVEYSAHPEAEAILEKIASEIAISGVRLAVSHRIGPVEVGEPALIACVASAHRAAAFDSSRDLIERIKREVPIWKRQIQSGGSHNWQGLR